MPISLVSSAENLINEMKEDIKKAGTVLHHFVKVFVARL